jgi:soluble lytic murein transglycosylase
MKKRIQLIIVSCVTVFLLVLFYVYGSQVWGEIVYPLDYQDSIKHYALQWNVRPNFVAGVIFTESHFNPKATSGVGAQGMMQIMPATGRSIAKELGEPFGNLYDPDTNIRYGTWYLKGLLEKFNGNSELASAAYNAGVMRASYYRDGTGTLPAETQNFIVKVKTAESKYDEIYGQWYTKSQSQKTGTVQRSFTDVASFVRSLILGY